MGDFERLVDGYIRKNSTKFILSIHRDGVTKYCCSYTAEAQPETIYWISPDDDRMACPFAFWSYKQAEWMFHQWRTRTGQDGWRFEIEEVA